MERRRSPSRILPRSSVPKSSRPGRRTISTPAENRKAAYSSRARVPGKRGAATGPAQSVVPGSNLQQHYSFSFQVTTDQEKGWLSQSSVEKAACTRCNTFAAGQTIIGGFLCEECIRIFIIQHQLWLVPAYDRSRIISQEGLRH